jgi:hypothetical protein
MDDRRSTISSVKEIALFGLGLAVLLGLFWMSRSW